MCYNKPSKRRVNMNNDFEINKGQLAGYYGHDKEIIIPEGVIIIGLDIFKSMGIEKVTFPKSLKMIDSTAFANNCLKEVHFKSPVTISLDSFANNKIEKVTGTIKDLDTTSFSNNPILKNELVIIGQRLIAYNGNAKQVVIPEGVEIIAYRAFKSKGIESVSFPKSLQEIEANAFDNNNLTQLNFNSHVIISSEAFANNKITTITGFVEISYDALKNNPIMDQEFVIINQKLIKYNGTDKKISIPEGVTCISNSCFYSRELKKVEFPSTLQFIEEKAFKDNKLREIHFNSPVSINRLAFESNQIAKISGPIKSLELNSFECNPIMDQEFVIIDQKLIKYNGTDKKISIPEGVTHIFDSCFYNRGLEEVQFPSSLQFIGPNAFKNNNLKELSFKSSVSISNKAFENDQIEKIIGCIEKAEENSFINNPILEKIKNLEEQYPYLINLPLKDKLNILDYNILERLSNIDDKKIEDGKIIVRTIWEVENLKEDITNLNIPIIYEAYPEIKSITSNQELNNLLLEIHPLLDYFNPFQKSKIITQLLSLAKEYQICLVNNKPLYEKNSIFSNNVNLLDKIAEITLKMQRLTNVLKKKVEIIKQKEQVKNVLDNIINKTKVEDNLLQFIINYFKLEEAKQVKEEMINNLKDLVKVLDEMLNDERNIQDYNKQALFEIIIEYYYKAKVNSNITSPYQEILSWLDMEINQIKKDLNTIDPYLESKLLARLEKLLQYKMSVRKNIANLNSESLVLIDDDHFLKEEITEELRKFQNDYQFISSFNPIFIQTKNTPLFLMTKKEERSVINEVLMEIYNLINTNNIPEEIVKKVGKNIADIMCKWNKEMKDSNFNYQFDSYINTINIPDSLKYELEVAKDLYGILLSIQSYMNELQYYNTITR